MIVTTFANVAAAIEDAGMRSSDSFYVQLKTGVTFEAFAAAAAPRLADRSQWRDQFDGTDSPCHPANQDWTFAIERGTGEPGGVRTVGLEDTIGAVITVTFGSVSGAAAWHAFSANYFSRVAHDAFASGAGCCAY